MSRSQKKNTKPPNPLNTPKPAKQTPDWLDNLTAGTITWSVAFYFLQLKVEEKKEAVHVSHKSLVPRVAQTSFIPALFFREVSLTFEYVGWRKHLI